ncbi:DinB family protein [Filimonas effusa]|uniref:DUF1572 domain-containing protein n=1 Tax=Filimonas effusa TaxID=2508721 RepID=A0A4Q1D976_9BACT|nr:DinB family protein [Filimonas effusa]RXK85770.1 DUF1572 domain-containing protein [Filimonas effusa]
MTIANQLAKLVRDFHFGGNYAGVHLRQTLADVTWQEATTSVYTLNSIAALVFHINYYINAVLKVLQEQPFEAHDKYSYDIPVIQSQADWELLLQRVWKEAALFAQLIEQLPDDKLTADFLDGKYGTYFRNLQGTIEHGHYHLGQISLIKKIIRQEPGNNIKSL